MVVNIWPTIKQTISVQASAACFKLEAQALVFYDAINVRAERGEGSLSEKYSNVLFISARLMETQAGNDQASTEWKGRIPDVLATPQ